MRLNNRTRSQRLRRYNELSTKLKNKMATITNERGRRIYGSTAISDFMQTKVGNRNVLLKRNIERIKKMIKQIDTKGDVSVRWVMHEEAYKRRLKTYKEKGIKVSPKPVFVYEWVVDTEQLRKYHAETDPEKKLEMAREFDRITDEYYGINRPIRESIHMPTKKETISLKDITDALKEG